MKARRRLQLGSKRCPCIGVLCFVVAFIASIFSSSEASADTPPTALKGTPWMAPATVLGVSNPYLVRAALPTPEAQRLLLSKNIRDFAERVDTLARYGVDLTQRAPQADKLQLRFQSRDFGGLLKICYRY